MSEFITHSREETVALGAQVAQHLAPGALIAFTGGLGAGKTAFCEGIARGLGCTDPVSSPTFAIVNYYRGPRPFAHFDLYRISTENDLCAAGFYDYLDEGAVVAAEWSENFADLLELEDPIHINIGVGRRQRFQRGHRGAERLPGEGQTLHRRQPDAQAGKAAGAGIDAVEVDVLAAHAAEFETVVDEGHQGLAVGHARIEIALVEQAVILQKGHAHGLARRIHG